MKAEDRPQVLVAEELADSRVDRAEPLQPDQFGRFAQRERHAVKRLVGEFLEGDLVDVGADLQVAVVAFDVVRCDPRDFLAHRVVIARVSEVRAVVEIDAVVRVGRPQLDVVRHALAAERPQFLEHVGRRDDRRARVERESVLVIRIGTATRGIEPIDHGDAIALGAKANGCRESAHPGPDNDHVRAIVARRGRALESHGLQGGGCHGRGILGQFRCVRLCPDKYAGVD